jgi:hypothetical protein
MLGDMTNTSPLTGIEPARDRARLGELTAGAHQADHLRALIDCAEQSARDRRRADAVFFAALRQLADQLQP